MHPVHHEAVEAEDDRISRINIHDEPDVVHDPADGWHLQGAVEPVDGVDLGNGADGDLGGKGRARS